MNGAEMDKPETVDELLAKVTEMMGTMDRYGAIEFLGRQDARVAADVYQKLQLDLYWKQRDLPVMVAFSQAGIQHCLTAADKGVDSSEALALRGSAKQLAYNLASFTWPGWNEEGIAITASEIAVGLEAARLNYRLAEELGRPDKAKANALWMLGAQQLASGALQLAGDTFLRGKTIAQQSGDVSLWHMLQAYALLARVLADPMDNESRARFEGSTELLNQDASQDSQEYARQLVVAWTVFQKPVPSK
jgi:hypothetical protein